MVPCSFVRCCWKTFSCAIPAYPHQSLSISLLLFLVDKKRSPVKKKKKKKKKKLYHIGNMPAAFTANVSFPWRYVWTITRESYRRLPFTDSESNPLKAWRTARLSECRILIIRLRTFIANLLLRLCENRLKKVECRGLFQYIKDTCQGIK